MPGPWRTDITPFWRDIYEAFVDNFHETIVVCCGSQMGKTEAIFNIYGHRFDDGPYVPALYVGPTEKQVKSISRDRVDKMLRSTESLWSKTEKGQRYGVGEKWISGVRLGFAWAGSATELASHPAGLVMVDERDRMDNDVGGEGDPVKLCKARAKNFSNRKIGIFSTPTEEGLSPTWTLLESGEMNFLAFPCMSCLDFFVPHLALLQWPDGCTPDDALNAAYLVCPHCGAMHMNEHKPTMLSSSRYIRHRHIREDERRDDTVFDKYVPDDDPKPMKTASYWISGLASPWVTFGELAKELIDAYADGSIEVIQGVVNTYGGELFREEGDAPSWEEVFGLRVEISPLTVPRGCQLITLGADVQKYGIYYVIRGWGYNSESWLIEHDYLAGETEHDAVWQSLRNVIQRPIGDRHIDRVFIDSGYRPGETHVRPDHAVYTFARSLPGTAYPTKGRDVLDKPYYFRSIDYSVGGVQIKGGVKLCHVNTDFFKRWVHARIKWPEGQPGGWHIHNETTEDYCRQMVSEELVTRASSGRKIWVVRNRNNHYFDCEVNAVAAAYSMNVTKLQPLIEEKTPEVQSRVELHAPSGGYERRNIL